MTTLSTLLIGFGLVVVGFVIGWSASAQLPMSWTQYDTVAQGYVRALISAKTKARAALAMWDDGDLPGARHNLVEISQLGEDK